jgi:hypothetical protein
MWRFYADLADAASRPIGGWRADLRVLSGQRVDPTM